MAEVDNISIKEGGVPGIEAVRAQLTGTTSTYTPRLVGNVKNVNISVEGTNTMTWTRSGRTITITGTNDDWVNITINGDM